MTVKVEKEINIDKQILLDAHDVIQEFINKSEEAKVDLIRSNLRNQLTHSVGMLHLNSED